MGSDIQRALLWILFGLSAFMLYDRWEVYNGRPSFFGAETQQVATTEAPKNEAALPSQSQTASLPAEAKTAVKAEPIQVETDLLKLSFDPEGAVIIGSELRKEKQTIPWTDTGLVGMILGNKADTPADVVLFTEQKGRTYLAQTGLIGGTRRTRLNLNWSPARLRWLTGRIILPLSSKANPAVLRSLRALRSNAVITASKFLMKWLTTLHPRSSLLFTTS